MGASLSTGNGSGQPQKTFAQHLQDSAIKATKVAQAIPVHLQNAANALSATATSVGEVQKAAGQLAEQLSSTAAAAKGAYGLAIQNLTASAATGGADGYYGGNQLVCGGYFGGDSDEDPAQSLKDYRMSLAAAAKDRVVRGLARALRQAGISVDEGSSLEEIAKKLQEQLPSSKNGTTFATDAKKQEAACTTIATVLNNEFTPGARKDDLLIDVSLGPVSVCRQVSEIVHSFSTGLHTEFLEVHASLTRVLRKLEMLDQILKELHDQTLEQIRGADLKVGADKKIEDFEEIYARAQRERERQMLMLRNFLSVTLAPAQEELAIALRSEDESHAMIENLQLTPGTSEFADALAMAISGFGTAASVAARVDKALKEVGLSVEEYLRASDMEALDRATDERMMSVKPDDIAGFIKAVHTLKENFYRRADLDFSKPEKSEYRGGNGATADRRIEARKSERRIIVKEFVDKSTRQYDALLKAVQELGPHLGKEVPLSDKIEALRNALAWLGQSRLGALNLELALIGYYSDASAREKKETFLAGLRVVQGVLDELMGMEMYRASSQYFAAMRAAIDGLVRTIDFYSDVIAKKYGGNSVSDGDGEVVGGQPAELADLPEIARSSYDLERAINTFLYFYYIAKVRANLRQTSSELEYYGDKYNEILGDAVAARLRSLQQEKTQKLAAAVYNPAPGAANADQVAKAKDIIEAEYKCKTNFYRALQALDLYMKAFTDGIVSHPDEVQDVKKMLDGVTVIARWFVEDTGNDLAAAFDQMPGFDGAARVPDTGIQTGGEHYYVNVATSAEHGNLFTPGIPQLGVEPSKYDAVQAKVASVYDNFQALKNLTNAFVRIGEKFGGKELRRSVFMSPFQIYKSLIDYLKCSALSVGGVAPGAQVDTGYAGFQDVATGAPELAVYFGSCIPGLDGNFQVEDTYFAFCVKAMAAKILTVIGVFDLFERPSPVYELTPTRMIIGGADFDAVPDVIPEASELYFRLPRLVEFYKNLFAFDSSAGAAATQISLLPEMEGVFSGIIRLIFQRVEGGAAESGDYSDLEVRQVVREINAIYENFRSSGKGSAISEALSSFVMEINRRYGLVKKEEWDSLQALLREARGSATVYGDMNRTNFAILPGEDEYETSRRAPSDRYMGPSGAPADLELGGKFQLDGGQWLMLKAFREKLDALFNDVSAEQFTAYSFSTIIRQGELEMRRAESALDKIAVAARLIQGSGSLAGIDVGKSFMFHETAVVGLNLLNSIHTLLANFRQRIIDSDVKALADAVAKWAKSLPVGAVINRAAMEAAGGPLAGFSAQARSYVRADGAPLASENGAAAGLTAGDLYASATASLAAAQLSDAVATSLGAHCIDAGKAMEDLLLVITGLCANFQSLVAVRFPGTASGQVHLDFSALRGLVQGLMSDVRYFMDLFRPHIAKAVIEKFEDRKNAGSLYWLEEHLFDGLIQGQPNSSTKTLEWMSRQVNQTYTYLTGYVRYSLAGLAAAGAPFVATDGGPSPVDPAAGAAHYRQYGRLMSRLSYYDASRADGQSGIVAPSVPVSDSGIGALISAGRPGPAGRVFPKNTAGNDTGNRIAIWGIQGGLLPDRSLMMSFNQLVAKFIQVFYDPASGKIYRQLIDGFANGTFSRAVMTQGHSMPDLISIAAANFGVRGDPTAQGVLAESLALILQRLATDINPSTQASDHLVATLSEIPLYIRESYRANLPAFIKFFELVQQEGEFYKQLMAQTQIQCGRPYGPSQRAAAILAAAGAAPNAQAKIVAAPAVQVSDANTGGYPANSVVGSLEPLAGTPTDSAGTKARIVRVIDAVAAGCYSMSNAAAQVLREIADEALYLQTQEDSIQEYKARYGKMPIMPLSSALTFLRDLSGDNDTRLMPEHSAGDASFKLMYGTRKLLGRPKAKFTALDAPGIRQNLEAFNSAASSREKVDPARYEGFLGNATTALRFVVDMRNYAGSLAAPGPRGSLLRSSLVAQAPGAANIGIIVGGPNANAAYAVRVEPQATLAVTESSYQDQELKKVSDVVGGATIQLGRDRSKEWILNIIDMNIMPINVHALMRGIPLAPLYNYAYTFEQMACLMFNETVSNIEKKSLDPSDVNSIRNTRQMFLRLLIDPYAQIGRGMYGGLAAYRRLGTAGLVERIFRGDDSLMMGRPKFESDQLYNKALFGSLIPTPFDYDEAGPPASGAIARGRDNVGLGPGQSISTAPAAAVPVLTGPVPPGVQAAWVPGAAGLVRQAQVPVLPGRPDAARMPQAIYGALTYVGEPSSLEEPSTALKQVSLGANAQNKLQALEAIGKLRFDTRLVRDLLFVSNIQRLVRLKLNQELSQYRNVIVGNHSVVDPGVTEYGFMPPSMGAPRVSMAVPGAYPGALETTGSRQYDNDRTTFV